MLVRHEASQSTIFYTNASKDFTAGVDGFAAVSRVSLAEEKSV
jgi:hypothetical protein